MNEMGFPQYAPPPEQAAAGPMYGQEQMNASQQMPGQMPGQAPQAAPQAEPEGGWQYGKKNGGSEDAAKACGEEDAAAQAQYMYQAPPVQAPQYGAPQQGQYMYQAPQAPQAHQAPKHEQYMYQAPPAQMSQYGQAPQYAQPAAAQYMYGQPQGMPTFVPQYGQPAAAQYMYGPGPQQGAAPGQAPYQAPYQAAYQAPYQGPGQMPQAPSHSSGGGCGCGKHDEAAGAQGLGHMMGLVNDIMSGRTPNPSSMMGMLESCSAQFWKGAAVGAALAILLTNNAVKDALAGMVGGFMGAGQPSAPQGE